MKMKIIFFNLILIYYKDKKIHAVIQSYIVTLLKVFNSIIYYFKNFINKSK